MSDNEAKPDIHVDVNGDDAIAAIGMIVSGALIVVIVALAGFYWVKPLAIHFALGSAIMAYAANAARICEADALEIACSALSVLSIVAGIGVLFFG